MSKCSGRWSKLICNLLNSFESACNWTKRKSCRATCSRYSAFLALSSIAFSIAWISLVTAIKNRATSPVNVIVDARKVNAYATKMYCKNTVAIYPSRLSQPNKNLKAINLNSGQTPPWMIQSVSMTMFDLTTLTILAVEAHTHHCAH